MTVSDPVLAAITERAAKAYPGPWESDGAEVYHAVTRDWIADALNMADQDKGDANAAFIAHSRADVDFLLARVGELEAQLADALRVGNELIDECLDYRIQLGLTTHG